jgi:glycosyltransferase involved in cell wall biosynthesis
MNTDQLVSIVIPCYKMGKFIGDALESIGKQTYGNWEVIAVDDCGPEDGTQVMIESFATSHPGHQIKLIRHAKNKGVSAARNTAIHNSQGAFIAFLDPDDLWKPNHISASLDIFKSRLDAGPVEAFRGDYSNNNEIWPIREWQVKNFPASLSCNNFIQPSAAIVRREIIPDDNWFTTNPALQHIEDYDLWIKLAKLGVQLAIRDTPTCLYRKHESAATSDTAMMTRLLDALITKHITFFMQMQGLMNIGIMNHNEDISDKLTGPLWARLMRLNQWLRGVKQVLNFRK